MDAKLIAYFQGIFRDGIEQIIFDEADTVGSLLEGPAIHSLTVEDAENRLRRELHQYLDGQVGPLTDEDKQAIEARADFPHLTNFLRGLSVATQESTIIEHANRISSARLEELLAGEHDSRKRATRDAWSLIRSDLLSAWKQSPHWDEEWAAEEAKLQINQAEDYWDRLNEYLPAGCGNLLSSTIASALDDIITYANFDEVIETARTYWHELCALTQAVSSTRPDSPPTPAEHGSNNV